MPETVQLDHTVINVQFDMDRAQEAFADLGFFLTERGYHSLGSINHLMMFGTDYLELIGLPPGSVNPLRNLGAVPRGINGLVFKTKDADATFAHLQAVDRKLDRARIAELLMHTTLMHVSQIERESSIADVSDRAGGGHASNQFVLW